MDMSYLRIGGASALMAAAAPAWAQGYDHPHMGYDGFGMVIGPLVWLAVLILLGIGIVALLRSLGVTMTQRQSSAALEALNLRFAKGEMDAKEYEERKKVLMG
ncbi:SHOCT domain-containing protein [Pseudogemmobacter sp. W21_MBD1_M6]|uniref:SHOCT domain-containing protein n=1 Tax=Pseudogemmobacter sp. W21_MBD1_M6 TaxID=3240271 RepID=UPI003F9C9600